MSTGRCWQLRADTGGTFTDLWARSPEGVEHRGKVLSSGAVRARIAAVDEDWLELDEPPVPGVSAATWCGFRTSAGRQVTAVADGGRRLRIPGHRTAAGAIIEMGTGEEAPILGARLLLGVSPGGEFPACDMRIATTRGTNALLERKGCRFALCVTRGFGDLPVLRDQRRRELFRLGVQPDQALAERVIELGGRLDAAGVELEALDEGEVRGVGRALMATGIEVVAVALLHATANAGHEQQIAAWLRDAGLGEVLLSSEVAPVIRLLPRLETTCADAYLAPVMGGFLEAVKKPLAGGSVSLMTSAGGLIAAEEFRPKDSLLSGPAGGLVGAAAVARAAGFPRVLSFDMGGTSTDVARIDGPFRYRYEQMIGPARVLAPALRIETVAAGGGSICRWRNGSLEVGPESAGADPGPACYGRGGPLTVTDVNLLLGLMEERGAGIPLDRRAAELRLAELVAAMRRDGEEVAKEAALLEGLRDIAVERMTEAIRSVSVREGYAAEDHALLAFGGAGPQHACAVAARLGIERILLPADAGLLSAWGLEVARRQEQRVAQLLALLDDAGEDLSGAWRKLAADAARGLGVKRPQFRWLAELRLLGQDTALDIECQHETETPARIGSRFGAEYRKVYGYDPPPGRPVEVVTLRVVAEEPGDEAAVEAFDKCLQAGPRLIQDRFRTCVIAAGWRVREGSRGTLLLERETRSGGPDGGRPAAVAAGLFRSRFAGIVAECGALLRRTALSTNVKERLDFSCGLLDRDGRLVMNAPHVPVHLGALGACVRECVRHRRLAPGDVVAVNHPAFGGSHLPDVTVIAAAFDRDGGLLGYMANRAHHAEIGGMTPGSMPAAASRLIDEGVVIPPTLVVENGRARFESVGELLRSGPWPSRQPDDNLADLEAQVAAVLHGAAMLEGLAREHGTGMVDGQLRGITRESARLMTRRLDRRLSSGWGESGRAGCHRTERSERLDDGSRLAVAIELCKGRMEIDFGGSAGVHPGNLNATPAIVRSVVLYVLRLWLDEDVPLNEGLLEPVELRIPEGMLNPRFVADPSDCPAVVGGNTETSQRLADLLCAALGICAHGPGTMNNLLFGDSSFGYYETIAGGAGAGPGFHGPGGRHVHMTNTAITDAEILEHRYPVRLRRFSRRRGSGGSGRWHGGDGVIRELEFLRPLTVSLLAQRRSTAPEGIAGGGEGKAGCQVRIRPNGAEDILPGSVSYQAEPGERLRIETPGGGGWG